MKITPPREITAREYTTRIVVAFGDVSGFGNWVDSISDHESELKPFMRILDLLIDEFEDQPQYFVKRTGDGFMVIMELRDTEREREVTNLLLRLSKMRTAAGRLINKQSYPRPAGFRVRITSGFAWKKVHRGRGDYIAKSINLASKLLRVEKTIPIVIHESVKDLIPPSILRKKIFKLEKVNTSNQVQDGVYKKDMDSLWSLRLMTKVAGGNDEL